MSRVFQLRISRQVQFCAGMIMFGILLFVGAVPEVHAEAADCVPHESCPCDPVEGCSKRIKTPTCCNPPPCEIYQELVRARAWRNANQPSLHRVPISLARDEDSEYAAYLQYKDIRKKELNKEHEKYSKCPYKYPRPKSLEAKDVGDRCEIGEALLPLGQKFEPISLEQARQDTLACTELVDAEYAEAMQDQYFCDQLTQAPMSDLGTWLKQEQRRSTAKINSLEGALLEYISLCSFTFDAKLSREVADKGIDALIDRALPKPPPKKAKPKKPNKKKTKTTKQS